MANNNDTNQTPSIINEPKKDSFQEYKKDPRKFYQTPHHYHHENPKIQSLLKEIEAIKEKEDYFHCLRLFKKREYTKIQQQYELEPLNNREKILREISFTAEAITIAAQKIIEKEMQPQYGIPTFLNDCKENEKSELSLIGMGKFGAQELNYESDLDVIFVFTQVGKTIGKKEISNSEYYSKFVQKYINLLSLLTETGRCYEIDLDLRPSGNTGPIVITYSRFLDHQLNHSQNWERMAVLRARAITGSNEFKSVLESQIYELAFKRTLPKNFFKEMAMIRSRVLNERSQENKSQIDIKLGAGSLMDIEFILQGIQLQNQIVLADLRKNSLFDLINSLKNHEILSVQELEMISEAHILFRTLESKIQIMKKRSVSTIHTESDSFAQIANQLQFSSSKELQDKIYDLKSSIKKIYDRYYHA